MIKLGTLKNMVTKVTKLQTLSNPDKQKVSLVTFLVTFCNFFECFYKVYFGKSYKVTKKLRYNLLIISNCDACNICNFFISILRVKF